MKYPDNEQGLIDWCRDSLEAKDVDPSLWMLNYLFDRYEHNIEQKFWVSWLYGTTYNANTAWVLWNEFPDYELVDLRRLDEWNTNNYKRLRYETDTRYNKGHLPNQFRSLREEVSDRTLREYFGEDFETTWKRTKALHKFGRYTTWYTIQTFSQCCHMGYDCPSLMLSDYSGSKSHRRGLQYAFGKGEDWYRSKLTHSQYEELESFAAGVKSEVNKTHSMNNFEFETLLCSYKKLFRERDTRFVGYYLERQANHIMRAEADGWTGVDWSPWWDARKEIL